MRLGQLARKLEVKTEDIVLYLEKEKQVSMGTHPNSKIADELVEEVTSHFSTDIVNEPESVEDTEVEVKTAEKEPDVVIEETKEPEHIDTPGVKIGGPKIVGKIDIPDKSQIQVEVDGVVYDQEFLDKKKKDELAAERERKAKEKEERKKEEKERRERELEQRRIEQERLEMLKQEENNLLSAEEEKKRLEQEKKLLEREAALVKKKKEKQKEYYAIKHEVKKSKSKKQVTKKDVVTENSAITSDSFKTEEEGQQQQENLSVFAKFIKWLNT